MRARDPLLKHITRLRDLPRRPPIASSRLVCEERPSAWVGGGHFYANKVIYCGKTFGATRPSLRKRLPITDAGHTANRSSIRRPLRPHLCRLSPISSTVICIRYICSLRYICKRRASQRASLCAPLVILYFLEETLLVLPLEEVRVDGEHV